MQLRILHLITDLDTGGAEVSLYRLLSGMDRSRFENQVVSLIPPGPLGGKVAALGIPVRSLGLRPGHATPAALFRLAGWLRRDRPDILQTWLYHADLLGLLAARLARVPVVAWNLRNAELDMTRYRRLSGLVLRTCALLSGAVQVVVSNSQAGRDFHARIGYHPPRWEVIPNGIDTHLFQPDPQARLIVRGELALAPEALLVGQVARFDPMKNQAGFLQAAGALTRRGVRAHFVMAGEGVTPQNEALTALVEREGLAGRVSLLGRLEQPQRLEAALDVLSTASLAEGFPNVVAEAMACGVPCAVTAAGDSAFLVGETGRVVPPGDPDALASAWQDLLDAGPEARRRLGEAARRRIAEHFSLERTVAAYQELYTLLADRAAGGKAV